MSSAVETKPMNLDNASSTEPITDGGDQAPPDPDPGPVKG